VFFAPQIRALLWVFVSAVLLYNIFAVYVTFMLNSIWHAILENFRPCAVWGVDLALYYFVTAGRFGEAWTAWSWMELAGMIMLFAGTAIYNGTVSHEHTHTEHARTIARAKEHAL
jgi:hypothetical protein